VNTGQLPGGSSAALGPALAARGAGLSSAATAVGALRAPLKLGDWLDYWLEM
jgi:hypothetical protein